MKFRLLYCAIKCVEQATDDQELCHNINSALAHTFYPFPISAFNFSHKLTAEPSLNAVSLCSGTHGKRRRRAKYARDHHQILTSFNPMLLGSFAGAPGTQAHKHSRPHR